MVPAQAQGLRHGLPELAHTGAGCRCCNAAAARPHKVPGRIVGRRLPTPLAVPGLQTVVLDVMEPRSERHLACFQVPPPSLSKAQLRQHGQRQLGWLGSDKAIFKPGGASTRPPAAGKAFLTSSSAGWTWVSPWKCYATPPLSATSLADAGDAVTADYSRQRDQGWQERPLL